MNRSCPVWWQLELPSVIAPERARAVLLGLAALVNQPRLVLEAIGHNHRVSWRLGADDDVALRKAAHVIRTHLPDTALTPLRGDSSHGDAMGELTAAAQLRIPGARHLPLAERDTESVTRSLLAALAAPGTREQLRLQVLLGVRTWPRPAPAQDKDGVRHQRIDVKHGQHGFGCAVRIAASSGSDARARQLVNQAAAALRGLETPGVAISLRRVGTSTVTRVSSPFCWPLWLSVDDLIPLLGWPVSSDRTAELPGVPPRHPKLLLATSAHPEDGIGFGLSTVNLRRGAERPVAQAPVDALQHRHVLGVTGVGKSTLLGTGLGPRSTDILHACVLTLARRGDASLVMVPLLLTNAGFRRSVIGKAAKADPLGLGAFWAGFENLSTAERQHVIQPLLNKLRQVLLRPSLRAIFGQRTPAFSMAEVFTKQKILLVKLGKDSVGPEASALLGSLVVSQLWQTALSVRTTQPAEKRDPVMVYIDEVQDYLRLPGSLADALAQARGLGMGITAAHQHRGQLGALLADVDANTGTKVCFRLSAADAREVATAFGDGQLEREDFTALGRYEAYAQPLAGGATTPWVSLTTQPWPQPLHDPSAVQARADARYGRPLDAIEADLLSLTNPPASPPAQRVPDAGKSSDASDSDSSASRAAQPGLGRRRTSRKEGSHGQQ